MELRRQLQVLNGRWQIRSDTDGGGLLMRDKVAKCESIVALECMRNEARKKIKNARNTIVDKTDEIKEIDIRIEQVGFEKQNQVRLPGCG